MCGDTSWSTGVEKICCCRLIGPAWDRIHQVGGFEKLVVGAIKGLKKIQVVDSLCPVAREQRSGPRSWRDQGRRHCCPRLDLGFFRSRGHEATAMSCPSDPPDGERKAFGHSRGSWNDDNLVCRESYTHTPYLACHCRRKLVGSLPWGIVYRQTGAQATNLMVTQDTDKVFIQVRLPCGCNTYVLRLIVSDCVELR